MRILLAGATSQTIYVEILDSTSTTGGRKTGLVFNTSSLTGYYVRNGGSATAITLATLAAANSAYSSGGFKEVDATNMPGIYRLDVPDAAVAASAASVVICLKGATGMVQVSEEIQLTAVNLQDAVRGGMTALPNANAAASGGLVINGSNAGTVTLAAITITGATTLTGNVILSDGLTISAPSTSNRSGITITGNGTGHGISVTGGNGATGNGIDIAAASTNGNGVNIVGTGITHGIKSQGGATGAGMSLLGGGTGGTAGLSISGNAGNTPALQLLGAGTEAGIKITGGATGHGIQLAGGGTSGDGLKVTTTSGHGINLAPVGTDKHGLFATGGNGGTSDGVKAVAGTGGVPIRGNITGDITGTVSVLAALIGTPSDLGGGATLAGNTAAIYTLDDTLAQAIIDEVDIVIAKTNNLPASPAAVGSAMTLTSGERNSIADASFVRTLGTESYAADGDVPTLAQAVFMLLSMIGELSISGTTLTCKKLDGSTTSMVFTLDSSTAPTSRTRSS